MVKNAPTFIELWPKIKHYFTNTIMVSHNASFDFRVVNALFEKYRIRKTIFRFGCTLRIAKLLWTNEEIGNHKLNTIASYLEVDHNHHQALSDARVCVDIINRGIRMHQTDDLVSLYDILGLRFGYLGPSNFYGTYQLNKRNKKEKPKINNDKLFNKLIILSGTPKHLHKRELVELLVSNGGYVDTLVSDRVDIYVRLANAKEGKTKQVMNLIDEGANIKVMNEAEILELVHQWKY
jgi:DNA polymerase-3 subunit epsilon